MILTNNNMVYNKYKDTYKINFVQGTYKDVLVLSRNMIHEGYELLTHPLSSSVKPNETPYKSVIISDKKGKLNYDSLVIIENSILAYDRFFKDSLDIKYSHKVIEDFKLIDLTVLESALNK